MFIISLNEEYVIFTNRQVKILIKRNFVSESVPFRAFIQFLLYFLSFFSFSGLSYILENCV